MVLIRSYDEGQQHMFLYRKKSLIRFSSYFGDYTIHITCMQNAEFQIRGGIEDKSKIIFLIIFLISQQKHMM